MLFSSPLSLSCKTSKNKTKLKGSGSECISWGSLGSLRFTPLSRPGFDFSSSAGFVQVSGIFPGCGNQTCNREWYVAECWALIFLITRSTDLILHVEKVAFGGWLKAVYGRSEEAGQKCWHVCCFGTSTWIQWHIWTWTADDSQIFLDQVCCHGHIDMFLMCCWHHVNMLTCSSCALNMFLTCCWHVNVLWMCYEHVDISDVFLTWSRHVINMF